MVEPGTFMNCAQVWWLECGVAVPPQISLDVSFRIGHARL